MLEMHRPGAVEAFGDADPATVAILGRAPTVPDVIVCSSI